jgi:hypothetical protein
LAFDGVAPNEFGHRRTTGLLVVYKMPHSRTFEKGNAPTIRMVIGDTAPLRKATEAERRVRGRVAVHAQELAHIEALFKNGPQ